MFIMLLEIPALLRSGPMRWKVLVLTVLAGLGAVAGCQPGGPSGDNLELLNVSYDPTRELWRELNGLFIPRYEKETGKHLEILQSHGGSSSQARSVIDGQE